MTLAIPIPLAKEAAPKLRSGSYADGMAVLESLERLVKSTSSALLPKKRASATRQMLPHVSLEEQTLKVLVFPLAKIRHISESAKYSESALSQKMEHLPFYGQTLRYFSLGERPKLYENNNPSQRYLYLPDLQALTVPYGKPCLSRTKPALKAIWFGKQPFPVRNYGWVGAE